MLAEWPSMEHNQVEATETIVNPDLFSERLFKVMRPLCPALNDLELFEFRYCLENITPEQGWQSV